MTHARLPAATHPGRVRLRVTDRDRALTFYRDLLGLETDTAEDGGVALSVPGGAEIIRLDARAAARPKPRRATGLYHYAILVPSRADLARAYLRLRGEGWPFQGFADHAVSEALYLADPDGNGIEIYADRPRETWRRRGDDLYITTEPLDLDALIGELDGEPGPWTGPPAGTTIGHIHLHVSDLAAAERFYAGLLGFDVVVRGYPGALFLSAGGYHHHVGLNTWAGSDARPRPEDAVGLVDWELIVSDDAARPALLERLRAGGNTPARAEGGWRVEDPDGTAVVIRAA